MMVTSEKHYQGYSDQSFTLNFPLESNIKDFIHNSLSMSDDIPCFLQRCSSILGHVGPTLMFLW